MVMNSIENPNETAKKSSTSTHLAEERIIALVSALTRGVLRAIGIGTRTEESADVEPRTDPNPAPLAPPFALRCDGRLLLSTRDLEGVNLSGRETFTGIVLSEAEAADALDRLDHAFHDAASHSAGWILRQSKEDETGKTDEKGEKGEKDGES
jgi:hypothetical protein